MSTPRGNAKSLYEACQHARDEINDICTYPRIVDADLIIFESFVRDFLSQKFAIAQLSRDPLVAHTVEELWKSITS